MSYRLTVPAMGVVTAEKIAMERSRQNAQFGACQFRSMAPERILTVLTEEVGELAKALLEGGNVEEEIVHVAAVAVCWLDECYSQ